MLDKTQSIKDVVLRYVGDVYSVGECYQDETNLENMKLLMELINYLLVEITDEYKTTLKNYEGSRIDSNKECKEYIVHLINFLKEVVENE